MKDFFKSNRGMSIIELMVYSGLLAMVLSLLYVFFIQVSYQRALQVTETEIYSNGYRILFDLQQTIKNATSLTHPAVGNSDSYLSLDSGTVVYRVSDQGVLEKVENGQANNVTDNRVMVDQISFQSLGPSVQSSTIKIKFVLKGKHSFQGRTRQENFQTAVSLR